MLDGHSEHEEFRLSWESCDPHAASLMAWENAPGFWARLGPAEWDALPWHASSRIGTDDIHDQHNTLKRWAETHEQPVRNVRFERRAVPNPEDGWEVVA